MSDNIPAAFSIIIAHRPGESPRITPGSLDRLGWTGAELIHVRGNLPSLQRNKAAGMASRAYLYFLDDDSLPDAENLSRLYRAFESGEMVAAVGGPSLTPESDNAAQRAFGHVLGSIWGSVSIRARYRRIGSVRRTDDRELILCNLAFRRQLFLDEGGFDTTLYPNEENELMERLRGRGFCLIHDPDITVHRSQRPGFRAFVRQLFGYGRGRAEQIRRRFRVSNLPLFLFAGFPVYLAALPLLVLWMGPFALLPLALHLFPDLLFSLPLLIRDYRAFPAALPAFFLCHLCYGAGLWRGLFGRFRSARVTEPEVRCVVLTRTGGSRG